jgi:uncharacterized protein (UPF0335 family)
MMPKNSIEGRAEPFVRRVESLMDELATLRGRYMAECKAVRGEIKDVYKDAKSWSASRTRSPPASTI